MTNFQSVRLIKPIPRNQEKKMESSTLKPISYSTISQSQVNINDILCRRKKVQISLFLRRVNTGGVLLSPLKDWYFTSRVTSHDGKVISPLMLTMGQKPYRIPILHLNGKLKRKSRAYKIIDQFDFIFLCICFKHQV